MTAISTHRLKLWLQIWEDWWTRKSYPHLIALVRIVFGGWLLFFWSIRLPHVSLLYSSRGFTFPTIPTFMPESLQWILSVPNTTVAFWIFAIHLLALSALTVGFFTRTSAFTAFCTSWYYFYMSHHLFHTSFDRLYIAGLLFLSFSGAGEVFSVQSWERYGSPLKWNTMVSVFSQRMFAFQITVTYLGVGLQKLWLPDWQGGEILWYSMMGVWGTPLAFKITSLGWSPLYIVAVNLVKIMECFLPFGFWIRKYHIRWYAFGMGLIFHTLIDMLLYIWWFAVLIPSYIVFFSPEEVYAWLRKISRERIT